MPVLRSTANSRKEDKVYFPERKVYSKAKGKKILTSVHKNSSNGSNKQLKQPSLTKVGYEENGNDDNNVFAVNTVNTIQRLSSASDFTEKWRWVESMCKDISISGNNKVSMPNDLWKVIDVLLTRSSDSGLTMDQLKKTWMLVIDKNSPLQEAQKRDCLGCLIPTEKIHESFVAEVLDWVLRKSISEPLSVISGVIILLYGWNLYGLVETDLLSNPVTYSKLLKLCSENEEMIPYLCVLIRKITSAKYISTRHIKSLYSLSKKDIGEKNISFVMELLYFYQYLRPDLFTPNPPYLQWKIYCNNQTKTFTKHFIPAKWRKALYEAKKRCASRSSDITSDSEDSCILDENCKRENIRDVDNINKSFFWEFAPETIVDVDIHSLGLLCSYEAMLVMLRKDETLPLLACDSKALELFNIYASMVFYHRFATYQSGDYEKCLFLLDRCCRLTIFVNHSLNAVTEWLVDFLPTWDGALFHFYVYELLRFIPLHVLSERFSLSTSRLQTMFVAGTTITRLRIWSTIEKIILRWPELYTRNKENHNEELKSAAEDFFVFIHCMICKFAAHGGHKDNIVLIRMCETYQQIIVAYKNNYLIQPPVPEELARMVILNDTLKVLDCCSKLYVMLSSLPKESLQSNQSFKFKQEMCFFYAKKKDGVPFYKLFKAEYDAVHMKEQALGVPEPGVINLREIALNLNCFHSSCLREYCVNPKQPLPIKFRSKHFRWNDLKKDAKYVYKLLACHCPEIMSALPRAGMSLNYSVI